MLKNLTHFGCSFAVGNGVPSRVTGLKSGAYVHETKVSRQNFKEQYGIEAQDPVSCGTIIADKLNLSFKRVADNGASNEMIFRKLLQTDIQDAFVLIGLTSNYRREALTTHKDNSHWHTWKMVGPKQRPIYKDLPFTAWGNKFTPALEQDGQIRTLIQVLYMQSFLQYKQVPYLIFHALDNGFDIPLTDESKKLLDMIDQKYFYKCKENITQHGYCMDNNLTVSDIDQHPNIAGQQAWADQLLPQVKDIINGN